MKDEAQNDPRSLASEQGLPLDEMPLCPIHETLDKRGTLEVAYGNNCVVCSLNERMELLDLLAPFAPKDASEDSITVLRKLVAFWDEHQGEGRVVVSYPAPNTQDTNTPASGGTD